MGRAPQYYSILVVDIENFGIRRNPVQALLREGLYRILDDAADAVGIDVTGGPEPADRGDGAFWLLPASIPKITLTGPFITALRAGLEAHGQVSTPEARMRLRVALHAGEVSQDQHGWVGEDLNIACRLIDLQSLRDALAQAVNSPLAVAVSDAWYRLTVRHGYPGIDSASYYPVPFRAKEVNQIAWITVPGCPPAFSGDDGASAASGEDPRATAQAGSTGDAAPPRPAKVVNVGPFAGANINARRVYGGNHYEVGDSQ